MDEELRLGYEVRTLNNLIVRKMEASSKGQRSEDVTVMNAWIIGFLYANQDKDVFQRDVEAEFFITRSTATSILKLMVKKGYLTRVPVSYDDRLKKLCLTEKAHELHRQAMNNIQKVEKQLMDSISEEELEVFLRVVQKLKKTLE